MIYEGKKILITGGTGSFGSAAVRQFLKLGAAEIRVFSRDEKKQEEEIVYPEMPRPDVPRDIEEQTLSDSFKNITNEEDEYK